ncbi:hypothetical protein [Paenibacillus herberti]|uniref:Uncharacterized protein n=1 Tax=Paenibacillus herberti TaxID=1619309 RepID=A0A229NX93_9BACL|nr:hypothetical protein [Paenibacillus herberti]OXM14239.1 hypothetical protein CGZ75_14850 [Paenibacillus herberti]
MDSLELKTSGIQSPRLGIRLVLFILLLIAIKKRKKKCVCPPPIIGETQGFNVLNKTSSITFTLASATGDLQSPPPAVGTTLAPNGRENFEVKTDETKNHTSANISYTATAANGTPITLSFTLINGANGGIQNVKATGLINTSVNQGSAFADPSLTITDKSS